MRLSASVIIFLIFKLGFSQTGTLSGNIILDDELPVINAHIQIVGTNHTAITDFDGKFSIDELKYGAYKITVSTIEAKKTTVSTTINGKNNTITISLKSKTNELKEVTVNGKTKNTKIETQGFAANAINTKEAGLRNIQTNELLNTTVGVKIRQNGGLGSNIHYSLNGLSGSAVRIFIDGIPISIYGSSFSLNSIPPSMIKRIEIYKGVVPGHLADDALGGAINIVLHNTTNTNFNASVSYGSFNTSQSSFNGLYRFDKSGLTIKSSGFHNYSDNDYKISGGQVKITGLGGVQTPITARRFNDAYRSTGGTAEIGFTNVEWADQFFVGVTASYDYNEIQHGTFVTIIPYKDRFTESDVLLGKLTYLKKNLFTKGLDVNINGSYGKRNQVTSDTLAWAYSWNGKRAIDFRGNEYEYSWGSQQEKNEFGPIENYISRNVASIRTGLSYTINDNHKFLFNHFYTSLDRKDRDEYASSTENTFTGTRDLHKNIYSFSYELNAINKKLKNNLFIKYYQQKWINIDPEIQQDDQGNDIIANETISSNKKFTGYGFATSYILIPEVTILASAEKAIRLPNETEVFGNDGDNVLDNPLLKPEHSNNLNLGLRLGDFYFKKHKFSISTNFFTRNIKDRIGIQIERVPDEEVVLYENQGDGTSKGVEGTLNYSYENNLRFNFNITHFNLKIVNRGLEINAPNIPFFTMNAGLNYKLKNIFQEKSSLNLFYSTYFTDSFSYLPPQGNNTSGTDFFEVPQQTAHDFGLSYNFPNNKFVISFDIKNIFDKSLYDNLRVQKPGRAFYLKLNYFINKF